MNGIVNCLSRRDRWGLESGAVPSLPKA